MTSPGSDPLVLRLSAGDERAFALLYERFAARLVRTATAILGSRDDAEDAVQDLFVTLVRSRRKLGDVEDLAAYLFVALRHAAARCAVRRQKGVRPLDGVAGRLGRQDDRGDPMVRGELREDLRLAMAQLPPEQREVVSYRLAGELTFAQIGQALQISTQTAASRYRYALEKLRLLMKERD